MSSDNLPAVAQRRDPVPSTYAEAMTVGATLAKSGFFTDAREESQAAAKVIAGMELGIGPMAAMTGIHMVKGKVTLGANLIAGQIKRSGRYDFRVTRLDETGCVIDFYESRELIGTSSFTMDDARNAGLAGQDNYKKHPRNMLFSRAMSNGAKWYCPDVFAGPVYTPDELGAQVDGETGEVLSVPTVTVGEPVAPDPAAALAKDRARELMTLAGGDVDLIKRTLAQHDVTREHLSDDHTWETVREAVELGMAPADEAPATIAEKDRRGLEAHAKEHGLDHDALKALAGELFEGVTSTTQIPADQVGAMRAAIETRGAELAKAAA